MDTDSEMKSDEHLPIRPYVAKPLWTDVMCLEPLECVHVLCEDDRLDEAAAICQLHGFRVGGRVEWLCYLAKVRCKQGLFEQAHAALTEALHREPGYQEARSQLGIVCIQLKEYEEAIGHLTLSIALNPRDYLSWGRLAIYYDDQGGYQEAAQLAWARSRRLKTDSPD